MSTIQMCRLHAKLERQYDEKMVEWLKIARAKLHAY